MSAQPHVSPATVAMGAAACWASAGVIQTFVPVAGLTSPKQGSSFLGRASAAEGASVPSFSSSTAAIAVGAAALAATKALPAARGRRSATTRRAEKGFAAGLIGGESAFNSFEYNYDPLGIAERCPQFLPWFREAELKHGRVAMLAWVGLVVPEIVRIPGPAKCYGAANVVDAHNACVLQENGELGGPLFQVFAFCGLIEMLSTFPKCTQGLTLENAGDYQLGVNFLPKDADKQKEMKLKELKNGRLAMIAFGGAITQAVLSGNGFPWLYAERQQGSAGFGASVGGSGASKACGSSRVTMRAEGGYKMSKSVPFLPVSPALEGYVGEEDGFDPMGVSLAIDIRWLREAELKHARVAMLATTGWIATDLGLRIPGEPFQVSTLAAHDAMVKFGAMPQMLAWIGYAELFGFLAIIAMMEGKTDRKPGDFYLRWLYPKDEKGQYEMQMKELRNGRLAMLAYGGIVTSAVLTQETWPFFPMQAQSTARISTFGAGAALCGGLQGPSRRQLVTGASALERSRSMPFLPKPQNLAGYAGEEQEFDPLGFSDTFDIKWLREAELKHGRVCMLATVGFFLQQWVTIPGFKPTPDAMQAVYTAPPGAMAALIFFAGYVESSSTGGKMTMLDMFEDTDREPGDLNFGKQFLLGKSEEDIRDLRLKELNNGRLAMMAFGGMVHHNLVVKGPLFPLFPEGWAGPQGSWKIVGLIDNQIQ